MKVVAEKFYNYHDLKDAQFAMEEDKSESVTATTTASKGGCCSGEAVAPVSTVKTVTDTRVEITLLFQKKASSNNRGRVRG